MTPIPEAEADGDRVELRGFGAFSVKVRDARIGRNPPTSARWGDCSTDWARDNIVSPYPFAGSVPTRGGAGSGPFPVSGGASRLRVTVRPLLPAVRPQAGLAAVLMVPHAIWHESALSFLGLGIPAHQASLGTMIDGARGSLAAGDWWPTLFPGLFIIIPTLAIAGLAGAWRERLNPRRRSELML